MTALERLTEAATSEPIELPRLTVAMTLATYKRMLDAIQRLQNSAALVYEGSAPSDVAVNLKDVVTTCEGIIKHANRLIEANR